MVAVLAVLLTSRGGGEVQIVEVVKEVPVEKVVTQVVQAPVEKAVTSGCGSRSREASRTKVVERVVVQEKLVTKAVEAMPKRVEPAQKGDCRSRRSS